MHYFNLNLLQLTVENAVIMQFISFFFLILLTKKNSRLIDDYI